MPWPTSQEYNEAVQCPQETFADPELRAGQAVTNALGIPMPCSGNFADVYQFHCGDTNKSWAIKCFTRYVPNLRERYLKISQHLDQAKLPFMVDFTFLHQGIKIGSDWFPILKMQWVEGFTLNQFLKDYLDKPQVLESLCQIWFKLVKRMREANLAHCDLQHGNVLLVPGTKASSLSIKLVDYDGMWVPALADVKSNELGHPSYQHPQRLHLGFYGIEVDRFPSLSIYTALRALLAGGRSLWDRFDNGDNVLFTQKDYEAPDKSPVFQELQTLTDPEVQGLAQGLALAARRPLSMVPLLEDVASLPAPSPPPPKVVAAAAVKAPAPVGQRPRADINLAGEIEFPDVERVFDIAPPKRPVKPRSNRALMMGALLTGGFILVAAIAAVAVFASGLFKNEDKVTSKSDSIAAGSQNSGSPHSSLTSSTAVDDPKSSASSPSSSASVSSPPSSKIDPSSPPPPSSSSSAPPDPSWENLDISKAQVVDGHLHIVPNGITSITTKQAYSGPVEITVVARTENQNIRLHAYKGATVIFNWEGKINELRVHRPDGAEGIGVPFTPLAPNTWYTLRWKIDIDGMEVFVDEKSVFSEKQKYDLSVAERFDVAAVNSVVDVKSFVVKPLEPKGSASVVKGSGSGSPPASGEPAPEALDGPHGMKFVNIRHGSFWMSKDGKNALREHAIKQDFAMAVTTVTQDQWAIVMKGNLPSAFRRFGKYGPKVKKIPDDELKAFPVESVSWEDVQQFLSKLNEQEKGHGWTYRLPTEAEWEYACRSGATSKENCGFDFYFDQPSNDLSSTQANFDGGHPSGEGAPGPHLARPCKVGSYKPNALGLYDMHGNVRQWCEDSAGSELRVIRGSGWDAPGDHCRASSRSTAKPDARNDNLGFRIVRVPEDSK